MAHFNDTVNLSVNEATPEAMGGFIEIAAQKNMCGTILTIANGAAYLKFEIHRGNVAATIFFHEQLQSIASKMFEMCLHYGIPYVTKVNLSKES